MKSTDTAMTRTRQIAKLNRRLRSAKALATWPNYPLIRAFGRMMIRRLTNAMEAVSQSPDLPPPEVP